jgi:hypothetical protein
VEALAEDDDADADAILPCDVEDTCMHLLIFAASSHILYNMG